MRPMNALGIGAAAVAALALVGVAGAQIVRERPAPGDESGVYVGRSERGDFQQALDSAIVKAQRDLPGADRQVRYRVSEIRGEAGGIRGGNRLEVEIELQNDDRRLNRDPDDRRLPRDPDDRRPSRDPDDRSSDLERAVRPELRLSQNRVTPDDVVDLALVVRNTSGRDLDLRFPHGQRYDFEIYKGDQRIWRWSDTRTFLAADQEDTVRAGETVTFRTRLDVRKLADENGDTPTGDLTVRAFFLPQGAGHRISDERVLTVDR